MQSPNNTLYSGAAVDLIEEPMVFHVPDFKGRYYTFQLVDKYANNFAYISQWTKGFREQVYAFCGPGWSGKLPIGVERIDVPMFEMSIMGRMNGWSMLPNLKEHFGTNYLDHAAIAWRYIYTSVDNSVVGSQ